MKKFIIYSFILILNITLISALDTNFTRESSLYINRTKNSLVNFTIGAENQNITQIEFTILGNAIFITNTNGTSASNTKFSNSSEKIIIFNNLTTEGIIKNTTTESFWFEINPTTAGTLQLLINATGIDKTTNTTTHSFVVNFAFSGYVKNETGSYQNATNVTIYQFIENNGQGPPTEIAVGSVLTNENGYFNFPSINGSANNYKLKLIYYNASGIAEKVGTVLPPFPQSLYYPISQGQDISINGSTFYLQPAVTLRLNATNGTTGQKFGYEVIDKKIGFPIESNIRANVNTVDVIVPSGREYSIMFLRDFSQFPNIPGVCDGYFMNDSNCAAPPKSNSTLGTLNQGDIVQVTMDLSVNKLTLYGCIGVSGNKTPITNITLIRPLLIPWAGFVPQIEADQGDINLSDPLQLNYSDQRCPNSIAFYNITLIGPGTAYLVEIYGRNNTLGSGGEFVAAFNNISLSTHTNLNLTMNPLLGSYPTDNYGLGKVNTTKMKINIQNESGGAIMTDAHVELIVKHSNFGTMHYIIETLTNGSFYHPILSNTNWAKVAIFPNDAPPQEKMLNLSLNENNVTLISVELSSTGDKGLRRMNASGQLEKIDASAMPIQLRFLRRGTNDVITSLNATDFNPLKALVTGNLDLELKVLATNVTIKFNNFDMFSAKQPPMFAVIDNNSMSSTAQTWKFGNFVPPDVYDNITLIIPYDENTISETWSYHVTIPVFYQEDPTTSHQFQVAWNRTAGDTLLNLTDEFAEYNSTRYRNYLTSTGIPCSKTNPNSVCYINTTSNLLFLEIPHFSGLSPSISGSAPSTPSLGGAHRKTTIQEEIYDLGELRIGTKITKELAKNDKIEFNLPAIKENHTLTLIELTNTTVKINIASKVISTTLKIGKTKKIDFNNDNIYDLWIKLNSINITTNKASITLKAIKTKIPSYIIKTPEQKPKEKTPEKKQIISQLKKQKPNIFLTLLLIIGIIIITIIFLKRKK